MRQLVFIVLFVAAGLSYFFFADTPFTPVDPHLSMEAQQRLETPGIRALEPPVGGPRTQRQVAQSASKNVVHASIRREPPRTPASIEVTIRFKGKPDARPSFEGLRVEAVSLRGKERFDGPPVGANGQTVIQVDQGGRYRVVVDGESVPDGYLASGAFQLGALDESGVAGAFVEVEGGDAVSATLTLFETSSVSGFVTGSDGVPLAGAIVRAQGLAPGLSGLSHDATTNELGEFELAGLLPFAYGVNLLDPGRDAHGDSSAARPPRQLFDLKYGPYAGVHMALGGGQITLEGTVVDELGEPFADVSVRAYYVGDEAHGVAMDFARSYDWSDHAFMAQTDAEGQFRVPGLAGVPVRIQVGAKEAANGPGRRAKFVPEPVEIKLRPASHGVVNAGAIELVRSRRFVVKGRIDLAKAEHPGLRLKHSRVKLQVEPYDRTQEAVMGRGVEVRPQVDYDKRTGRFTLSCDTPLDECTLTVTLRGHPDLDKEFRFHPVADETLVDQVLSFP